jgi:hypothetical protein
VLYCRTAVLYCRTAVLYCRTIVLCYSDVVLVLQRTCCATGLCQSCCRTVVHKYDETHAHIATPHIIRCQIKHHGV